MFSSAEYCIPLVRIGGLFVAAKGHNPQVRVMCLWKLFHLIQRLSLMKAI